MQTDTVQRAVILARVSSRDQEDTGYSLPSQERLLRDYCQRTNLESQNVFKISETASKASQRVIFNEMLDYAEANKIKIIVCEKVDRFVRNFKDTVIADDWLEADADRQLHFVKDGLVLHKGSRSQEKLNWGMRVVIAKNYIDNLKEEVEKGQREKLLQGWSPDKPPPGYVTAQEGRHKIQVKNSVTAPLIKLMFELYDSGNYSLATITAEMANQGLRTKKGKPMGRNQIYRALNNPFYCGRIRWKGKEYRGKQETIITEALFERVQARMKRPNPPVYNKHNPLFKGLIFCTECKCKISWELQRTHWYGRCNRYRGCKMRKYTRAESIDEQVMTYFEALICPVPAIVAWVKEMLLASHQEELALHNASIDHLTRRQKQLKDRADRLYDDRLDGVVTIEKYQEKVDEIAKERIAIVDSLDKLEKGHSGYIKQGLAILELTQGVAAIYRAETDITERRALLSHIFSNIGLDGQTLLCEYRKEAFVVLEKVNQTKELEKTFEHDENGLIKEKEAFLEASRTIWWS